MIPKDELIIMASELRPLAGRGLHTYIHTYTSKYIHTTYIHTVTVKQIPNFVETPDNLVKFFIDRVRSNLHVVLCMSPVGVKFPERARKFPGESHATMQ